MPLEREYYPVSNVGERDVAGRLVMAAMTRTYGTLGHARDAMVRATPLARIAAGIQRRRNGQFGVSLI